MKWIGPLWFALIYFLAIVTLWVLYLIINQPKSVVF